jgi:hypothetical protein
MNLRITFAIFLIVFICGSATADVHAVSLADLMETNGTIRGAAGNLRFNNFSATISARGNASPMTLDQITISGSGASLAFIGPFTAHSPGSLSLNVRYDVNIDAPGEIDRFALQIPQRATITGVTRTDIGPSAGFTVIGSVPGVNPSIGVCSSARFGCPNNDTAFLQTPINAGSIGMTISVFAAPEFPLGPPGGPSGPQPTNVGLPSVVQTVGLVFPIPEPTSAVLLGTGLLALAIMQGMIRRKVHR